MSRLAMRFRWVFILLNYHTDYTIPDIVTTSVFTMQFYLYISYMHIHMTILYNIYLCTLKYTS